MSCAKCGGLTAIVEYEDWFERHRALHCHLCGKVEWLEPVPYSPPEPVAAVHEQPDLL